VWALNVVLSQIQSAPRNSVRPSTAVQYVISWKCVVYLTRRVWMSSSVITYGASISTSSTHCKKRKMRH
jgi:hypothetical protein